MDWKGLFCSVGDWLTGPPLSDDDWQAFNEIFLSVALASFEDPLVCNDPAVLEHRRKMLAWEAEECPCTTVNLHRLGKLAQEQKALIDRLVREGWKSRALERAIRSYYEVDPDTRLTTGSSDAEDTRIWADLDQKIDSRHDLIDKDLSQDGGDINRIVARWRTTQEPDYQTRIVEVRFDVIIPAEEQGLLRTKALFGVDSENTHQSVREEVLHCVKLHEARFQASIEGKSEHERALACRERRRMAITQPGRELATWRAQCRESSAN